MNSGLPLKHPNALASNRLARLPGWAVDPVKSRGERSQSHRVVVFPWIDREAIVEALGLEFVEELGECGCRIRKAEFIVATYREIEANRSRHCAEGAARIFVDQGVVREKSRTGGDDALKQTGPLLERVEGELSAHRVTQQSAVGGIGAVGAIDERDEFVLEKVEKRSCATTAAAQGFGNRGRREVLRAESHGVTGGRLADVDDDDRGHAPGIDVIVLEEGHQGEMPAIEDVEHGVRLLGGVIVFRQRNEQVVRPADL